MTIIGGRCASSGLLLTVTGQPEWQQVPIQTTRIHFKSNKSCKKKGKGVPLHAMEAHGVRGGIAPTHT
jgi:hypothetical protein